MSASAANWSMVCHLDLGNGKGRVVRVDANGHDFRVTELPVDTTPQGDFPVMFLGLSADGQALLMDRESKVVREQSEFPEGAFAAYAYPDRPQNHVWFMYDGEKGSGCDRLNCGDKGSSVTIIDKSSALPEVLGTLCVGRGHHVTTYIYPSPSFPDLAGKAYVSNLMDGTISVVGNDPEDPEHYLRVLRTINLCQADREEGGEMVIPNNAFPHGKVFSPLTGKVYSLNNGYGTVAVIDPHEDRIEKTFPLKVSSNLLLSPDGRYLVGKGADRKTDDEHVIGRLTLIDADSCEQVDCLDLPDIYPSTYRFNPAGDRLYVTSAATGKGVQRDNLRKSVLQVYDVAAFPRFSLLREIELGVADCGRRPIAFTASGSHVLVPNPTDGTLAILAGEDDRLLASPEISDQAIVEFSFSLWDEQISAC